MKRIEDFKILENKFLNEDSYLLVMEAPSELPEIFPGQFAQMRVDNSDDVFLRRPFSIHDVDYEKNTISIFIKIIGKGTKKLGDLKKGDILNTVYPLGNYFSEPNGDNVLFVGGGSGIAPFLLMAKQYHSKGIRPKILLGGRKKKDILQVDEFSKYGDVYMTTEDGSLGEKGLVTHHSLLQGKLEFDNIYVCGPNPMMKAVGDIAVKSNIPCEASLENLMACGFGVCLCCVTPTNDGENRVVCAEGPVFNVKDLSWQI
jgi:dihydroorotate dehydrogenase electron transfer subunit